MRRGRLPLTALRSFEVAGRLLSFSRAADELLVSQAAVSRQIQELETFVGKPLFVRLHRHVELTDAGSMLLQQLTAAFEAMDRGLSAIMREATDTTLRLSVEPTFAAALLIRRLNGFREAFPDIDIVVESTGELAEFRPGEAEVAIRFSHATTSWPHVQSKRLFDSRLTPVATPAFLAAGPQLHSPVDLRQFTLLHEYTRDYWSRWFGAAGYPELASLRGPVYPDGEMVGNACRLGHGVALADLFIDADALRTGIFVRPFDTEVSVGTYWLVARDFERLSPAAQKVSDWILDEFSEDRRR